MSGYCRAGFTLIEMLVVIAIIGVLAAMMTGAVSKVMDCTRASSCANNLKQTAAAVISYENDFHAAANFPDETPNSTSYVAMVINPFICLWKSDYMAAGSFLQCPGETAIGIIRDGSNPQSIEYYAQNAPAPIDYHIDHTIGTPTSYAFRTYYYKPFSNDYKFLVGDGGYDTVAGDSNPHIKTRNHSGHIKGMWIGNVACTDGHVGAINGDGTFPGTTTNPWASTAGGPRIGETLCPHTKSN